MTDFYKIKTTSKQIDENDFSSVGTYDYALITMTDGVDFISAKDADIESVKPKLVELRAFSESKELHIVSLNGSFIGRIREDGKGDETSDVFDGDYLIWGKPVAGDDKRPGITKLHDDRGIDLQVPFDVENGKRAFLKIRSYARSENGSLNFYDFRIYGVEVKEAKENE